MHDQIGRLFIEGAIGVAVMFDKWEQEPRPAYKHAAGLLFDSAFKLRIISCKVRRLFH